jgi:hypothetical protein
MAYENSGITFNGRRIIHPGAYDRIDTSAMTASTPGSLNRPILIGTADAGEAGKVMWWTDPSKARAYFKNGDLPTAVELAFSPLPEGGGGASIVGTLLVNPTVAATKDVGGGKWTAKEFGTIGNEIQVKMEDGTIAGTKKVSIYRFSTSDVETWDNIGAILEVNYTGTKAYAEIAINAGVVTTKTGADSATATVDLTVDGKLPQYSTIDALVSYINSMSGYAARIINIADAKMPVTALDTVTAVTIKNAPKTLLSAKTGIETRVNVSSQLVNVSMTGTPANFPWTYLAGGQKGTTPPSWSAHFLTLRKEFFDLLCVLSADSAIHAEAAAHVQVMETRRQKQYLFFGGAGDDPQNPEDKTKAKQRASAMNYRRAVLCYPAIYHPIVASGTKLLPAYMTAAMVCGRVAGVPTSEPITFDFFNISGLGVDLVAGDPDIDELIASGVCVMERVQNGGIRLAQGVTTYLGPVRTPNVEISTGRTADEVSDRVTNRLEDTFVGSSSAIATNSSVTTEATNVLDECTREKLILGYRNIRVRFEGTAVYVDYEAAITEPINFILVTSHFVPSSTFNNLVEGQQI